MTSYEVRVRNRKPIGPLPADLIVRGLELRRVPFDAQVREEGTTEWVPLASVDEFYEAMGLDDAKTRLNQPPVFDTTDESAGDEATRVLSSLWSDDAPPGPVGPHRGQRAQRNPPSMALPPAPSPPGAPQRPGPQPNMRRLPAVPQPPSRPAAKAPPPARGPERHLAEAGTYEAPTAVVDRLDVASASLASGPGRASGPPPPRPLPPIPSLPPAPTFRPPPGTPPARRVSQPSPGLAPVLGPPVPPAPVPARSPMLTPSPEAAALMDADEDDDDVRVVRDISETNRPPDGAKQSYSVRPAAGAPASPSQCPPAYRPDHADELTAPARRLVKEQERTRKALAWVSAALGLVLLVLTAVLLLR